MAMVGGAYLQDKNTHARTLTENVGGACARRGTYMWDTTVLSVVMELPNVAENLPRVASEKQHGAASDNKPVA